MKPELDIVAGLVWEGEQLLVTQRKPGSHLGGYWEFPGGKPKAGETHSQTLQRELQEEVGIQIDVGELFHQSRFSYPERQVFLFFYRCGLAGYSPRPQPLQVQQLRWVLPRDLSQYRFPPANQSLLTLLQKGCKPGVATPPSRELG